MFKYVTIDFPETTLSPQTISQVSLRQMRYAHELVTVHFKDWGAEYDVVSTGSPVHMQIAHNSDKREFYGYVHHVQVNRTPGEFFCEVTFIGASYLMKQPHQTIYTQTTADQVVKSIASNYNFACYAVPHPRVYPQISQAGITDWELLSRLAKQCGYTLRTQNTELYFQPILDDYTNLRTEAPSFIMRSSSSPDGSTIYSFKPNISESMPYEEGMKAAVAVSGVNSADGSAMSITQQIRNSKMRTKQQNEFFDRFDVDTVANTPLVALYEAEAAENRNTFPYRAFVEVLGTPSLRPDMPIYLGGVGQPYEGYWVVLKTEHKIVEKQRNVFVYTTVLEVGSDSLGVAANWTDNKQILTPDYLPKRTIIPNVRQTKVDPKTELNRRSPILTPSDKGTLGNPENRAKTNINVRSTEPSQWQTQTQSLETLFPTTYTPTAIVDRIRSKYGVA